MEQCFYKYLANKPNQPINIKTPLIKKTDNNKALLIP